MILAELRNSNHSFYAIKCLKKDQVLEDDDIECTLIERKVLALGCKHPFICHLFCTFQTEVSLWMQPSFFEFSLAGGEPRIVSFSLLSSRHCRALDHSATAPAQ